MPIRLSAFGRVFAPSWPMTLLTLILLTLFVILGRWQWHRGEGKQAVWAEYERNPPAAELGRKPFDAIERFDRIQIHGEFEPQHQFLLDNRSHGGAAGYEVLTPFHLTDGRRVLVNRGWVPFSGYRDRLPEISMKADAPLLITGRIDELPSGGLASGHAAPEVNSPWPKVTSFPTHEELQAALGSSLERRSVVRPQSQGARCEWTPPGMPPSRHFSYAIQWWVFAWCCSCSSWPSLPAGVLMGSRRGGRGHVPGHRGSIPAARGRIVRAVLRQAMASGRIRQQGRAHHACPAADRGGPASRRRHTRGQ
jgi:surfeit locus 1 family protein